MTSLVQVCTECLADSTEALHHEALLMHAQWTTPDATLLRGDGTIQTWHEPTGLALMARHPLLTSPN